MSTVIVLLSIFLYTFSMTWFYLVLLSVVGTAIANIFRRVAMKYDKSDAIASAIVFQLVGALIVGIFAFWHGFVMPPIARYPLNVILQAVLWGSATLSLFKASQYLEASETAIIAAGNSVITIVSSIFFLHEHFGPIFIIGTALIIFSVMYISHQTKKMTFNKGTLYALAYCLLAGVANTNDAYMLKYSHSDTLSLLTIGFLAPGIFLFFVKPTVVKKMKSLLHISYFSKIFLLTFFYALAAIAFFFAIHVGGQASQVSPINQSAIILTVLIGALFLNEKDHLLKKIFCTFLVTVGVILLS